MLEKDPRKRAKLEELIESAWVSNNKTENLEIDKVDVSDSKGLGDINRILKISNLIIIKYLTDKFYSKYF
jgi:hypothetical protein